MNWAAYLQSNPDLAAYWASLAPQYKAQFQNDPALFAEWHFNTAGQSEGRAPPQAAPASTAPGPQDVLNQVNSGPLAGFARDDLDVRNQYAGAQYGDELGLNANAYNDQNIQTAQSEQSLRGVADAGYGAELSDAALARGDVEGIAYGQNAAELGDANAARSDREGLAYGDLGFRFGEADSVYAQRAAEANARRGDVEGIVNQGLSSRQGANATARDTRFGEIEDAYGRFNTEAGRARGDREAVGLGNRDAMRGVGTANFDRTLGYLDSDLATRTGYTNAAIADRASLNDIYQGQARDRVASMLGVTGQVGKAARAGAERANELDLEFADTSRAWRNQDYSQYADNRLSANAERGGVDLEAERGYGLAKSNAADQYASDSLNALGYRTDARGAALNDYTDEERRAYDDAYAGRLGAADAYGDAQTAMTGERAVTRAGAYNAYGTAKLDAANAYAGARSNATGRLYDTNLNAANAYAGARSNATANRSGLYNQYAQDAANAYSQNLSGYYANNQAANRAKWGQYGSAYDSYSAGKANAYGDWLNAYNSAADTGYNAGQAQINAGQVGTNNINTATGNAADAYAQGAYTRADASANMWNNIGAAAGSVSLPKWGGTRQQQAPADTAYGTYRPTTYRAPLQQRYF